MKKYTLRRLVMMVLAIFVIGLGLELFILSAMGSEASSSFARASGNTFGIPCFFRLLLLFILQENFTKKCCQEFCT